MIEVYICISGMDSVEVMNLARSFSVTFTRTSFDQLLRIFKNLTF